MSSKYISSLCLGVWCTCISCHTDNTIIQKFSSRSTGDSQHTEQFLSKKVFFENGIKEYEVNFVSNGWQILDSTVFENTEGQQCNVKYTPEYDIENRKVLNYSQPDSICSVILENEKHSGRFSDDKYSLILEYSKQLNFLFSKNPIKTDNGYLFKDPFAPSLFLEFGIPYDEVISSFDYKTYNEMIIEDVFHFNSFVLQRNYQYEKGVLKKVKIILKDRNGKILLEQLDDFKLEVGK